MKILTSLIAGGLASLALVTQPQIAMGDPYPMFKPGPAAQPPMTGVPGRTHHYYRKSPSPVMVPRHFRSPGIAGYPADFRRQPARHRASYPTRAPYRSVRTSQPPHNRMIAMGPAAYRMPPPGPYRDVRTSPPPRSNMITMGPAAYRMAPPGPYRAARTSLPPRSSMIAMAPAAYRMPPAGPYRPARTSPPPRSSMIAMGPAAYRMPPASPYRPARTSPPPHNRWMSNMANAYRSPKPAGPYPYFVNNQRGSTHGMVPVTRKHAMPGTRMASPRPGIHGNQEYLVKRDLPSSRASLRDRPAKDRVAQITQLKAEPGKVGHRSRQAESTPAETQIDKDVNIL